MKVIFVVSATKEGGYDARAPGHSILVHARTWDELRAASVAAANQHFADAPMHPDQIQLHLVRDETIAADSGLPVEAECNRSWIESLEPARTTATDLQDVLAELSSREPVFHRPEFGTTRADVDKLMADDYWETGASGRRYSRDAILDGLEERFAAPHEDVWETSEFQCRRLGEDVYLLTYTLLQDRERLTRRATIWRRTEDGWKILYHQGTVVQDA